MTMQINNERELFEFVKDVCHSYATLGDQVIASTAADSCYFEGIQWLSEGGAVQSNQLGRLMTNLNPDRTNMRVTANRTTRFTQKVIAQTYPRALNLDVPLPDRDMGSEAQHRAQTVEDLANIGVESSGILRALRHANHMRCVTGIGGVGLTVRHSVRGVKMGGKDVPLGDRKIEAFPFSVCDLVLDPGMCEFAFDLDEHDFVMHKSTWTADKIERVFGMKLDRDKLKTVGELERFRLAVNRLSDGKLFDSYRQYSKTKGATVNQLHVKGDDGRFGQMFVVLSNLNETDDSNEGMVWVNEGNTDTPFGGDGLPMVLLHGHRRTNSIFSMSEPRMMRDDQNRLNILETLFFRHLQKTSGFKMLMDKRSLVNGMSQGEFESSYNNRVGGALWYDSKGPHQRVSPPQLLQTPMPSPLIPEYGDRFTEQMQLSVHRSEPNFGQTKSHVPDASFQKAIEEADQVGQIRISEDLTRIGRLMKTMVSTDIGSVQMKSASTLASLHDAGFDEQDFSALLNISPVDIGLTVRVNPSTVRHRSHNAMRQDLDTALSVGAISQVEFRKSLADDLDTPITQEDGLYAANANKAALSIMGGEQWEPIPMGIHGEIYVSAFRKALQDRRIKRDPEAKERLVQAIQSQVEMNLQEQINASPELALQRQQQEMASQQAAQEAPPEPQGTQPGASATVADVLAGVST